MLPIELQIKDLENIEKAIITIKQVSVTLAFVSLGIWVWVRAPGLDFTLPLVGGTARNLNVGYAVIFGPLLVSFFLVWQFLLRRRLALMVEALDYNKKHQEIKSLNSLQLLLSNFASYKIKYYFDIYWVGNKLLRSIFYFLIPVIVSLVCFFRLVEFIPMTINGEDVVVWDKKATAPAYKCTGLQKINPCEWEKTQHLKYWLFGVSWSGVQPTLMRKEIKSNKEKGGNFPYVYPYTVWLSILLFILNIWLALECYKLSSQPIRLHFDKLQPL
jgi:hypothetical protein